MLGFAFCFVCPSKLEVCLFFLIYLFGFGSIRPRVYEKAPVGFLLEMDLPRDTGPSKMQFTCKSLKV